MADGDAGGDNLRGRIARQGEDALGKLAQDLLENPLVTGAISRAFEARERAVSAQETAMSALNLPSAADLERLTRRLRSVSQRLEGIEDGVDRLDRRFEEVARTAQPPDDRLAAIEAQLSKLAMEVAPLPRASTRPPRRCRASRSGSRSTGPPGEGRGEGRGEEARRRRSGRRKTATPSGGGALSAGGRHASAANATAPSAASSAVEPLVRQPLPARARVTREQRRRRAAPWCAAAASTAAVARSKASAPASTQVSASTGSWMSADATSPRG